MTSSIARKVVASFQKTVPTGEKQVQLSPREEAVLDGLAKGLIYKQLADQLEMISPPLMVPIGRQTVSRSTEFCMNRTEPSPST